MSGLHISCGDYLGGDKSACAFERVILNLPGLDETVKERILSGFDNEEHTAIDAVLAEKLLPYVKAYLDQLVVEIGHDDCFKEMDREEQAGTDPTALKWGEGRGWRLYCAGDLLEACKHSAASREPVVVCLA